MLLDDRGELADNLQLPFAIGRSLLGDVIDQTTGAVPEGLSLAIVVRQSAASLGAPTVAFDLVSDSQASIATDGSATHHFGTGPLPLAALVAGRVPITIPIPDTSRTERYIGVLATVAGATLTAGRVSIVLTAGPSTFRAYADNIL